MRSVAAALMLLALVSCGGSSGGSNHSKNENAQREQSCLTESCQTPDSTQVDLLESMVDVNVTITPNEILFRESKVSNARGRSISCQTKVNGGDIYRYELRGEQLDLYIGSDKLTMDRLNESSGLRGAWAWKGYDNSVYTIRSVTFISDTRMIIKTHCEN